MNLRERIFDLVFPDLRRTRQKDEDKGQERRSRKRRTGSEPEEGYDPRYYVRHRP